MTLTRLARTSCLGLSLIFLSLGCGAGGSKAEVAQPPAPGTTSLTQSQMESDLSILLKDVVDLSGIGYSGGVAVDGDMGFPVCFSHATRDPMDVAIAAGRLGKGRVIAMTGGGNGPKDFFAPGLRAGEGDANRRAFARNVLVWLTAANPAKPFQPIQGGMYPVLAAGSNLTVDRTDLGIKVTAITDWTKVNLDPAVNPVIYLRFPNTLGLAQDTVDALISYVQQGGSIVGEGMLWNQNRSGALPRLFIQAGIGLMDTVGGGDDPTPATSGDFQATKEANGIYVLKAFQQYEAALLKGDSTQAQSLLDSQVLTKGKTPQVACRAVLQRVVAFANLYQQGSPSYQSYLTFIENSVAAFATLQPDTFKATDYSLNGAKVNALDIASYPASAAAVAALLQIQRLDPIARAFPFATAFTGPVPQQAPRLSRTISLDLADAGQGWYSTGLYAVAGEPMDITLGKTSNDTTPTVSLRIGAHTDNLTGLDTWSRPPIASQGRGLGQGVTKVKSLMGGLIYISLGGVNTGALKPGDASLSITLDGGVVEAPFYISGKTTATEWDRQKVEALAPWGEIAGLTAYGARITSTLPTPHMLSRSADQMEVAGKISAKRAEKFHSLMGFNAMNSAQSLQLTNAQLAAQDIRPRNGHRYVCDRQISAGYMHSGYPIMTFLDAAPAFVSDNYTSWGFNHELGHNHAPGEYKWTGDMECTEVTNNIFSLYFQVDGGIPAPSRWLDPSNFTSAFSHPKAVWQAGGSVKERLAFFVELAFAYDWDFYAELNRRIRLEKTKSSNRDLPLSGSNQDQVDWFMAQAMDISGHDLRSYFTLWGFDAFMTQGTKDKAAALPKPPVALENLRDRLPVPLSIHQRAY